MLLGTGGSLLSVLRAEMEGKTGLREARLAANSYQTQQISQCMAYVGTTAEYDCSLARGTTHWRNASRIASPHGDMLVAQSEVGCSARAKQCVKCKRLRSSQTSYALAVMNGR